MLLHHLLIKGTLCNCNFFICVFVTFNVIHIVNKVIVLKPVTVPFFSVRFSLVLYFII